MKPATPPARPRTPPPVLRDAWLAARGRYAPPTREARDTLFMLAVIGWTVLPHLLRLQPWVSALCGLVLLWRAVLALRQQPLPGRWAVGAVLLAAVTLTYATERTLLGKEAGVTLLVVTMALKTLELRARRDALVVFFLGFFLVLTQFLYSQSLWTALAMGLSVWGWLTALTLAHMPAGQPRLTDAGKLAARAALFGAPIMAMLFMLFPRIGPLWAVDGDMRVRTGLSEQLRLGDVAELAADDSIAFRVRFAGAAPSNDLLYFRGPVLSRYDGREWTAEPPLRAAADATAPQPPAATAMQLSLLGAPVQYDMTLEPTRLAFLPLLEMTPERPSFDVAVPLMHARPDATGQWRLRGPMSERLRLSARAWPQYYADIDLSAQDQQAYTALPMGRHTGTVAWATALLQDARYHEADADLLAAAVMRHIGTAGYGYTMSPGKDSSDDAVDEFWLQRRTGFCEHYASAFVIVMRALGVPARIVTGYQGVDPMPSDGYWIVRQSNAHAWAEYWQVGRGWVRADPTAAVAPDRIERGLALRPPTGFMMGAIEAIDPSLRLDLRRWLEGMDHRWNQWVLNYGQTQQFDAMRKLGFEQPDWVDLGRIGIGLVVLLGLAGAVWAWRDARRQTPWQRVQSQLLQRLHSVQVDAKPHEAPGALAQRVEARWGPAGGPLAAALLRLERLRYGPAGADDSALRRWRTELRRETLLLRRLLKRDRIIRA